MPKSIQANIINALSEIEKEVPVNDWIYKGVQVWPLVRVILGHDLFIVEDFNENQIANTRAHHKKAVIVLKSIFKLLKCFVSDFKKNDFGNGKVDVLYVVNSSTSFFKLKNKWYNPYSDSFYPFVERSNLKQRVLELSSDFQFRVPRFRKSKLAQMAFFFMQLKTVVKTKIKKGNAIDYVGLDKLNAILTSKFEKYSNFDVKFFNSKILLIEEYRKYFRKKLQSWQPKVMVCQGYYSPEIIALISVCRELDVKTIEIQHGVQGEYHQAYSNWGKVPQDGYAMFPDLFWTWGESEKKNIDKWIKNNNRHRCIVGGNPCAFVLDEFGNDVMGDFLTEIKNITLSRPAQKNIIFTAQAFFELPEFFLETIKNTPDWNWWIRIHPQYTETASAVMETFKNMGCNNVLIEEAGKYPLIALLSVMDLHITEFSSSVLEAYSVGVPSVVINEKGRNLYSDLIDAGIVNVALDEHQVISSIINLTQSNNKLESKSKLELFQQSINKEIIESAMKSENHVAN